MPITRRTAVRTLATAGIFGVAGCLGSSDARNWDLEENVAIANSQQYNAPGCGCCKQFASYLRENIGGKLTETVPEDIVRIKEKYATASDSARGNHSLTVLDKVEFDPVSCTFGTPNKSEFDRLTSEHSAR